MSMRAELLRLGLRWFMKRHNLTASIAQQRQRLAAFERWVPAPPPGVVEISTSFGGVRALKVVTPATEGNRNMLFLHGGGYAAGSPALYRHLLWRVANSAAAKVIAIAYRLAPEHPFPAALDDAASAWRGMLDAGIDPGTAIIIGDSAGGGLTLALALRLRDEGAPMPAALIALSPWTDLAATGESLSRNARADPMLNADEVPLLAANYLNGADPRHPYASPLYGRFDGLPPTLIQVGSDEILRDDSERIAARMREAGCAVELEIWPRMPHVFHAFALMLPEARRAIARVGEFAREHTTPLS